MRTQCVYSFGGCKVDGNGLVTNSLGVEWVNLAELCRLGIPVPAGFVVSAECRAAFTSNGYHLPSEVADQVIAALNKTGNLMGKQYGDPENPLLISCHYCANKSQTRMRDTILNIGLSSTTIPGMIKKTGNPRFVWDCYCSLIRTYAGTVMEEMGGLEPAPGKNVDWIMCQTLNQFKKKRGCESDTDLKAEDLELLATVFKRLVKTHLGKPFPDDPIAQLWGFVAAAFKSCHGRRTVSHRRTEGFPDPMGHALLVQALVFGNAGDSSASGVAFTRDPATGDNTFCGEWLANAQIEDVVGGKRTPNPINGDSMHGLNNNLRTMQDAMPATYRQLLAIRHKLEKHDSDMLAIDFTVEEGKLWIVRCDVSKCTDTAALNIAVDMANEGMIDRRTAVARVIPAHLPHLLLPQLDSTSTKGEKILAKGLPAGCPCGACGEIVFAIEDAVARARAGKSVILLSESAELWSHTNLEGWHAATGILTACGGMTSDAALFARGHGSKCCITGCNALKVQKRARTATISGDAFREGDWLSLDGANGYVYKGRFPLVEYPLDPDSKLALLLKWADENPERCCGAERVPDKSGSPLFRTLVNMLDNKDCSVRINAVKALARIREPLAVDAFIKALEDPDPEVRRTAARALGRVRNPRAAVPMMRALRDTDSDVRVAVVMTLGEIKCPEAVDLLIAVLKDNDDHYARQAAALSLSLINDPSAFDRLIGLLEDEDSGVRFFAAMALGHIKDPGGVNLLIKALGDMCGNVSLSAALALVMIGKPAVGPLTKALDDANPDVRLAAALALKHIEDSDHMAFFVDLLRCENTRVCENALLVSYLKEGEERQ